MYIYIYVYIYVTQFESPDHADNARRTLSGCALWGRNIIISASKHSSVQASRSDAEDEGSKLFGICACLHICMCTYNCTCIYVCVYTTLLFRHRSIRICRRRVLMMKMRASDCLVCLCWLIFTFLFGLFMDWYAFISTCIHVLVNVEYVYICVCVHMCGCVYVYTQASRFDAEDQGSKLLVCLCKYVYICTYTHIYVHMNRYFDIHIYRYIYIYVCIHIYVYICVCIDIYIYIYIHSV